MIEKMMFPIIDLDNVVPAVLHITLGIVLRFFNMIEEECRKLDKICTTVYEVNWKEELDCEWKSYSVLMEEKLQEERCLSEQIIEVQIPVSRFQAVASGNPEENLTIAKLVNQTKGSVRSFEGKCESVICVVTKYDENPLWVTCDSCEKNVHAFCEGFSVCEEINIIEAEKYDCLKCSSIVQSATDLVNHVASKAAKLLDDECWLKIQFVQLQTQLDKLKSDVSNYMGP